MTIYYRGLVAKKGRASFLCLLFRWRGSIFRLFLPNLVAYALLYFFIVFLYRYGFNEAQKLYFEAISMQLIQVGDLIPITFLLGFYVTMVVDRFWELFAIMPWPDSMAICVSQYVHGDKKVGKLIRRTVMRYICVTYVLTFGMISLPVKKRFPSLETFVDTGLLHEHELKILEHLNIGREQLPKHWVPLLWSLSILHKARREGIIDSDYGLATLLEFLLDMRSRFGLLLSYDWVTVPLVYTQVVTVGVYTYFAFSMFARQFLEADIIFLNETTPIRYISTEKLNPRFPFFLIAEFCFVIGWLKVAETNLNPFGEDEDDFDVNWLIDRHVVNSFLIVDTMYRKFPKLEKDPFWKIVVPPQLPYTERALLSYNRRGFIETTAKYKVKKEDQKWVDLDYSEEDLKLLKEWRDHEKIIMEKYYKQAFR